MTKYLNRFRVESTRLPGYDYSKDGAYFITICTYNHRDFLCKVISQRPHSSVELNVNGQIILECWNELPLHYSNLIPDEFIIMPDHIHAIIRIRNTGEQKHGLFEFVRALKSFSSRRINLLTGNSRVWQRGFHDHIIRNDEELNDIRYYIRTNPDRWKQ